MKGIGVFAGIVSLVLTSLLAAQPPATENPFPVEVEINASREVRTIPRTLFGVNLENMWNANGAWNPWTQSPNEELLGLAKDLNASLFRFPGGTLGDFYDWRNGVGPRSQRPKTQPITGEGDLQPNDFGTDEALDFAKSASGRLLISVNAGTGQAEDAAAWVHYVREHAAKDAAHTVTWWEVGNELYHKGDDLASSVGLTPERYASKFLTFAAAMRKVDPSIRIGAIGLENYGPYQFNTHRDWNETVLRLAGEEMDFFAVHNAYAPVGPPADADIQAVYRSMLGAPELIRANLQTVSRQIEKYGRHTGRQTSIAVTEWGPIFDVRLDSPYILHPKTLGCALFTASALKVFMETPSVEIANFFKLSDLNFMGLVGVREGMPIEEYLKFERGTLRATASYYAFQLIATRFENVLVGCTVQGPTYDTTAIGWTGAAKDVPYLDIAASKSVDGKRLTILAINRHFKASGRAIFKIQGLKPDASGRAWTLHGTGIDAHTGTGSIEIPGLEWGKQAENTDNPRFSKGEIGEVTVTESALVGLGDSFDRLFPAHSVTIIELTAGK